MEKAILEIRKSNSGKLIGSIKFENGKSMPIPSKFQFTEEMDNKECEVERVKGQPVKIIINSKELSMKQKTEHYKQNGHNHMNNYQSSNNPRNDYHTTNRNNVSIPDASAPYNFVPLNEKVIPIDKPADFDKYTGNTGFIQIDIETKTPIYIRGKDSDFYQQAGKYRIPGSSMRGMIRTIVEIISWSKFGFSQVKETKKRRYFYRKFMDKSNNLKKQYCKSIVGGNNSVGYYNKVNAGYIYRTGLHKFEIHPAAKINNTQFFRVEDSLIVKASLNEPISVFSEKDKYGNDKYKLNPLYKEKIIPVLFKANKITVHKNHSVSMRYAEVTQIRNYSDKKNKDEIEGFLICSGYIGSKKKGKHLHWVVGPESNESPLTIPEDIVKNFNDDFDSIKSVSGNKENPLSDLKQLNRDKKPCFYVVDSNNNSSIIAFGFTGHFRLPYAKSLDQFVPKNHKKEIFDLANTLFGIEDQFTTRVFFEDAILNNNDIDKVEKDEKIAKVLLGPKATSFQIYLEQNKDNITPTYNNRNKINGWNNINSYNDDTSIRGNKLYWHKSGEKWKETDQSEIDKDNRKPLDKRVLPRIKPINKGANFSGKIRFENLTNEELGALLFALDLPEECCHKIGMGKPLGLGSIRIKPTLHLSNRKERYKNLFNEFSGLQSESQEKIITLKNDFEKFILPKVKKTDEKSLWDLDRMKELKKMLTFTHGIKENKISYMEMKEFKNRGILPHPTGVN